MMAKIRFIFRRLLNQDLFEQSLENWKARECRSKFAEALQSNNIMSKLCCNQEQKENFLGF